MPSKEQMTPRQRMLAAMRCQPIDRIPTDIWMTGEVKAKLAAHFGSWEAGAELLHIDGMAGVEARYAGPALPQLPAGQSINYWGMRFQAVDYGSGEYSEQCHWPLADARTIDDLERYPWPQVQWFDFSAMYEQARSRLAEPRPRAMKCGYMAPFYMHNLLRGLEQSLIDPLDDPEFTHHLLRRVCDFLYQYHRRMFEACRGLVDVAEVTDDLGTQTGPMISHDVYREFYKPWHRRFAELCREFGILVFHHDDGAMSSFLPDLLEVGINLLNPVQWRCPGMDPAELKRRYGSRLCFHGAIDNQQTLPHGTPEEVRAEVRRMIDALAADKTGYILAPCHNLQPVTPVENIVAMYDEAHRYGAMA